MDELFREEEINRIMKERAGISSDIREDIRDTSNAILDTITRLTFEKRERTEIRNLTKEINNIAKNNYNLTFNDLGNSKTLSKLKKDQLALERAINDNLEKQDALSKLNTKAAENTVRLLEAQNDEAIQLLTELKEIEEITAEVQSNVFATRFRDFAGFLKSIPGLKSFAQPFVEASDAIIASAVAAEKENREITKIFEKGKGLTKNYLRYLDGKYKELGIVELIGEKTFQNGKTDLKYAGENAAAKLKEEGIVDKILEKNKVGKVVAEQTNKTFLTLGKTILGGVVLNSLLEINKAQTELNREVGRNIDQFKVINGSATTLSQQITTIVALTKQFGFSAQSAFDSSNIKSATELEKLTGLTAEQAGRLALFSQTTGTSLEYNLDRIIAQTGEINIANKSAVSQRRILEDIGNVSSAIALTFQGNTSQLAEAAQNARILGINLQQVDNIASGLLDIESSISSEFEAEVISGKQLNLERARFFALTNDLNGLVGELKNNQEAINSFATGTRLEQEAIAGALGMSREEMADMIFQQRLQLGITDEQARLTAGLTQKDFERLTIQESIATSLTKIGETLSRFIEPVLGVLAENSWLIYTAFAGIAALSLAKTVASLAQMAVAAGPLLALGGGIGAALLVGSIVATILAGISKAKKTGDAIIPAGKGPIISTREGGLIQGTANDDVIMAPGIARGGRNAGLSQADVAAIAKAVRDGASQAQINLDGGRVSNRLQPSLAVNTRKYSI